MLLRRLKVEKIGDPYLANIFNYCNSLLSVGNQSHHLGNVLNVNPGIKHESPEMGNVRDIFVRIYLVDVINCVISAHVDTSILKATRNSSQAQRLVVPEDL